MSAGGFTKFRVGLDETFDIEQSGERASLNPGFVKWLMDVYGPIRVNLYFDPEIDNEELFETNMHFEHMINPSLDSGLYDQWRGIAFVYPHEAYQMEIINAVFRLVMRGRDALFLLHAPIGSDVFNYAMRYARELTFLTRHPFANDNDGALADNNFLMLLSYTKRTAFTQRNAWCSVAVTDWLTGEHSMSGSLVRQTGYNGAFTK